MNTAICDYKLQGKGHERMSDVISLVLVITLFCSYILLDYTSFMSWVSCCRGVSGGQNFENYSKR